MLITSPSNSTVKQIRRLQQKKYRLEEGLFYIEGLKVVLSAFETEAPVEILVTCPDLLESEKGRDAVNQMEDRGVRHLQVTEKVFRSISERDNPMGIGAVVRMASTALEDLPVRANSVFAAFVDISDPGNLGTCLRTLDAMGGEGAILVGHSTDPWSPSAVKASMGAVFHVPVCMESQAEAVFDWASRKGIQSIASTSRAGADFDDTSYAFPILLWLGSEAAGLSQEVLSRVDQTVRIPMAGNAGSLNLAVAAGLLLHRLRKESDSAQPTTKGFTS